jgi:hypothetical protein
MTSAVLALSRSKDLRCCFAGSVRSAFMISFTGFGRVGAICAACQMTVCSPVFAGPAKSTTPASALPYSPSGAVPGAPSGAVPGSAASAVAIIAPSLWPMTNIGSPAHSGCAASDPIAALASSTLS